MHTDIAHRDPVRLRLAPSPFRRRWIECEYAPGRTVLEMMAEAAVESDVQPEVLQTAWVAVGDRVVPKRLWPTTRPKAGARVTVVATPQGDFGGFFVQILTFAATALVPEFGPAFQILGNTFRLGSVLLKGAISLVGTLVANALAKPPSQHLSRSTAPLPGAEASITGVANQAAPYQAVPRIYGRITNYHPPLAARPYTRSAGAGQFLHMLFAVGYGELEISDIKIGQTPITAFKNVAYEVRNGTPTDPPVTLYPSQVAEESMSAKLTYLQWHQRTTEPDTEEISIDVTFPAGLMLSTNQGHRVALTVYFNLQYRAVGSSTWLSPQLYTYSSETGALVGQFYVSAFRSGRFTRGVFFRVPKGQYEVRIQRATVDDQGDHTGKFQSVTQEESWWTALRSTTFDPPVKQTGVALIAVQIQADDQLNGVIDQLNCTVEAKLPVWDGANWVTQKTRNPAWAYVDVLTGGATKDPLPTSRLNLSEIKAWADDNDSAPRYFDAVIAQTRTVFDVLKDIAATGRASFQIREGLYTVVQDEKQTTPVQHFTPRNSSGFRGAKPFSDPPHALIVRFPNESSQGQVDEMRVYADGYSDANATKFDTLDLPYTTQPDQAFRHARFALAHGKLRPEVYELTVDFEHVVCTRGDLVRVTHDVPMWGVGYARVKSVTVDGSGNATAVTLDAAVAMESGKSYSARFRLSDGTSIVHAVTTVAGEQTTLTFATAIPSTSPQPAAGDLCLFGETGTESVEMIVTGIEPQPDMSARLTLVDHAPQIFDVDSEPIPPFDPQITLPPIVNRAVPPQPVIDSVISDESVLVIEADGTLSERIVVHFHIPMNGVEVQPEVVHVQYRRKDGTLQPADWTALQPLPSSATEASIHPVETLGVYDVRLRTVSQFGMSSEWMVIEDHTVIGKSTPPPDVPVLFRDGDVIRWTYDARPIDLLGFEVRVNDGTNINWDTAQVLTDPPIDAFEFDISGQTGTKTFLIKAVDRSGNYSTTPATLALNVGDQITSNVVLTQDEDASGYPGQITGGTVSGSNLQADIDNDELHWGLDSDLYWGADATAFWPPTIYKELQYVASLVAGSNEDGGVLKLQITVAASAFTLEYRLITTSLFWGADLDLFWGADTSAFWPTDIIGDWSPWPGEVGPIVGDGTTYEIRLIGAGGETQAVISNFDIIVDVPDLVEYLNDVSISSTGTRLPITLSYRAIKAVNLTVQDDGGTAVTAKVKDKNATLGPLVETLNSSGTAVAGTVDATIQGY